MSGNLYGLLRTKLSKDWRFPLLPQWVAEFGERPIVITLTENAAGWRLHPEPNWFEYFSQPLPLPQWDLKQIKSRSRVTIPSAIYYASTIERGAALYVVGKGDYLEACSAHTWETRNE